MTTSSADPDALDRFVDRVAPTDDALAGEVTVLREALDALRASGSDGIAGVPRLDDAVADLVASGRALTDQVEAVAGAFRQADRADPGAAVGRVVTASDRMLEDRRSILFLQRQRQRAWQAFRAEFLLMDQLVPMSPDDWRGAVFGRACPVLGGDAYYSGGGGLVGPDGRLYPIVVPNVVEGGRTYHADANLFPWEEPVSTLRGADPGWATIGTVTGVAELAPPAGAIERGLVGAYGMNSNAAPVRRALPAAAYSGLAVEQNGMPSVVDRAERRATPPGAVPPSLGEVRSPAFVRGDDGHLMEVDRMDPAEANRAVRRRGGVAPNAAARRVGTGLGGADLVVQAGEGYGLQDSYNNLNLAGYQAVLEENVDGRRRAQVRAYRLYGEADGTIAIEPNALHLDEKGAPRLERYRFAYARPVMDDPDKPYRVLQ